MPPLSAFAWLLPCLLWALCANAWALEIRTAAQDSQPKYIREDSGFSGVCPDIWSAIARVDPQLRFTLMHGFTPLARIEMQLEHGEIDAFCGLAKTPNAWTNWTSSNHRSTSPTAFWRPAWTKPPIPKILTTCAG